MGLVEFIAAVAAIAIPVLVGVGAVMITPPHAEYRPARICFFASASLAIILAAIWGAQSSLGLIERSLVVGGIGALAALLLMGGLGWVRKNEQAAAPHASNGGVAGQPSTKPAASQTVTPAPAARAEEHPRSYRAQAASLADIPGPDRARYKKALQGFYLETDELLEKIIAMPRDDEMDEAQRLADESSERASAWIKANMGPVAEAKYKTPIQYMYDTPWPGEHNIDVVNKRMRIIDGLKARKTNLEALMASDRWDQPEPESGPRSFNPALGR
jgi:hypothetical protein